MDPIAQVAAPPRTLLRPTSSLGGMIASAPESGYRVDPLCQLGRVYAHCLILFNVAQRRIRSHRHQLRRTVFNQNVGTGAHRFTLVLEIEAVNQNISDMREHGA